jgi:hypothetical protein
MLHNSRKELRSKFEVQITKAGTAHSFHGYAGDGLDKPRAVLTRTLTAVGKPSRLRLWSRQETPGRR